MKMRFFVILLLFLILPGCGVFEITQDFEPADGEAPEATTEIPGSWVEYTSSSFGYSLWYPKDAVLYAKVAEVEDKVFIITPTEDATEIHITDATEADLLAGEVNTLTFRVIEDARSGHEWISQHLNEYYPGGIGGQTSGAFAGESAIIIRGTGLKDSPEKLLVVDYGGFVFVISYQKSSITFDQILETFVFKNE